VLRKVPELRLARSLDAATIATMSRDLIESGLGWTWRSERIARCIRDRDTITIVADNGKGLAGFAIMWVGEDHARLNLLAVRPEFRRQGVGRRLVEWLESSALVAGTPIIYLEVRAKNHQALSFYRRLGYRTVAVMPGYYKGRESALRMARDLWEDAAAETGPASPWRPPSWLDL
jgi:ribosomal-protein-alanine N-acetyltransferase